jgi:antitoxin component of MazEF toxin-antitoxin module
MNTVVRRWGNSAGIRVPKKALENSKLNVDDVLEVISFEGGITLRKKEKKSFRDISMPLVATKGWKFDREEANERR